MPRTFAAVEGVEYGRAAAIAATAAGEAVIDACFELKREGEAGVYVVVPAFVMFLIRVFYACIV